MEQGVTNLLGILLTANHTYSREGPDLHVDSHPCKGRLLPIVTLELDTLVAIPNAICRDGRVVT